jgi:hypothetical protein
MTRRSRLVVLLIAVVGVLAGYLYISRSLTGVSDTLTNVQRPAKLKLSDTTDGFVTAWTPVTPRSTVTGQPTTQPEGSQRVATTPSFQTLPELDRMLSTGNAGDRQRALDSLREIAAHQGDGNNAIRDVLRKHIYHGNDDDAVHEVQLALDEVESAVANP